MEIWSSIVNEIINNNTIVIICFFVITSLLGKYTERRENKRILSVVLMILFHILLTVISGLLSYTKSNIYSDVRLSALILGAMATISMSGLLIFKIIFPKVKIIIAISGFRNYKLFKQFAGAFKLFVLRHADGIVDVLRIQNKITQH